MSNKIPVTVVVPVKNEEANIAACLRRLSDFKEVIVVDSGSSDRTPDIVRAAGIHLINFEWDGKYPKKRNWFLLNHQPACEWVLFLDADEFVDGKFSNEVRTVVRSSEFDGFWLNYTNYFLGCRLQFGLPQRKLALFRFGKGFYERIEENSWSRLDMEVHEHPIVEGMVGEIKSPIDHNDERGIMKFIDRHRDYALWESQRIALLENSGKLTRRQRLKYRYIRHWWFPWIYFLYTYFIRLGVLDGRSGFLYAFYKTWYFQTTRLLILENDREFKSAQREVKL